MLKGERREGLVIMEKHPSGNTNVYTEENDYFLTHQIMGFIPIITYIGCNSNLKYVIMHETILTNNHGIAH